MSLNRLLALVQTIIVKNSGVKIPQVSRMLCNTPAKKSSEIKEYSCYILLNIFPKISFVSEKNWHLFRTLRMEFMYLISIKLNICLAATLAIFDSNLLHFLGESLQLFCCQHKLSGKLMSGESRIRNHERKQKHGSSSLAKVQ